MPKDDLPELTKSMHDSQENWRNENWNRTMEKHKEEIEKLLQKLSLFDIWSNLLQDDEVAKTLIPEAFVDAYVSVHFAGYGLYKYAHICLRSELETTLRLIFFSTHKVEFKWWSEGNEWYRENVAGDVWGRGYLYFEQLETIKKFEKLCADNRKLFGGRKVGIKRIHRMLSRFIHSGAGHFQTRPGRISPKYEHEEFGKWIKTFVMVQEHINILLILGFPEQFKKLSGSNQRKIKETGVESSQHREILEKILAS